MTSQADIAATHAPRIIDDSASRAFGVRRCPGLEDGSIIFRQDLAPSQLDRSGAVPLRSIGTLIDAAVGSAAYQATSDPDVEYVVSHLSVSMTAGAPGAATVTAVGETCTLDSLTGTGVSTARVESEGRLQARVMCRSMQASRQRVDTSASTPEALPTALEPVEARTPPADLGLSGTTVGPGPGVEIGWAVHPWMGNGLGTVQGGVILSCAAAVAEQAAALGAERDEGQRPVCHRVVDVALDIMRSPLIDPDVEYRWRSTELRRGRRLTVVSSTLHDADGHLYDADGHLYAVSTATTLAASITSSCAPSDA